MSIDSKQKGKFLYFGNFKCGVDWHLALNQKIVPLWNTLNLTMINIAFCSKITFKTYSTIKGQNVSTSSEYCKDLIVSYNIYIYTNVYSKPAI